MCVCISVCLESVFGTLPHTQRGMPMVINGDPKGKNMLYCNGKTVVIRDIEVIPYPEDIWGWLYGRQTL